MPGRNLACAPRKGSTASCATAFTFLPPPRPAFPPAPSFEAWAQAPWEIQDMPDIRSVNWMRISFHLTLPEFKSYRGSGRA